MNYNKIILFLQRKKKATFMDVIFDKDYLQEIYYSGKSTDRKHWYQPEIIRKYIFIIDLMISLPDTEALKKFNSLNYEKLKGNKIGLSSVRINNKYRIEFEEYIIENQVFATICNIKELSNHYK